MKYVLDKMQHTGWMLDNTTCWKHTHKTVLIGSFTGEWVRTNVQN